MIIQGACLSFLSELFEGVHDFSTDVLKLALFDGEANLSPSTTTYSTSNEIVSSGYTAGGIQVVPIGPTISSNIVFVDFDDVSWSGLTATVRAGLIYNETKANAAIWVLDFGVDKVLSDQMFSIAFPPATSQQALIRIVSY